ncbi:glycoside hydrolase TIM-barrel-like domain-containing protein [Fulvimarina sp. MAC8]|uniref:baseplate multidomain protein megatron n=1 Tax=Fulvimarina sp. MAC8 TaxID=3162874 RepID=UPI0032EB39E3
MATLLLQTAGSFIGGGIGGPIGAILGRAAGALAGSVIDGALFGKTEKREGPRLDAVRFMQADEGGGVPRVYGTARIAGQVIWGTRFEEDIDTERHGGKGGPPSVEVTTYSYFGNFAVGLCEGPIAGIRRIWADGEEIDQTRHDIRLYRGHESQEPDPLIEAKQGGGNAPAYRGIAYLVFERLPLERWGNRIPQISCEVLRPVGDLENRIEAITIIPGATEHGVDPEPVREEIGEGEDRILNRNVAFGESDWTASIDEMDRLLPQLSRAALVVAWFGDDLRAGHCEIMPGVEIRERKEDEDWLVGDVDRSEARLVSRIDGSPAYGGTPSDRGVVRAIEDLRDRGLAVTYYPFLLMDVPPVNELPDPYGGTEQAAFPWRGRMTLDLAEGLAGSADKTAAARSDIERFVGTASRHDFAWEGDRLRYFGPNEWSYRRMIFHQAHIADRGGAAAFVIGSEMRGLTRIRDETGRFPFVEALIAIAAEIKAMMPGRIVTYAADWSEYACYRPADGTSEIHFNLDSLWASDAIDVVGIDNYLPLSDWRGEGEPGAETPSQYDRQALAEDLASGEWYDWYYATNIDRQAGIRTPISDGAVGKPFVYRDKDIRGWWSKPHYDRANGVETGAASPWVPMSKPIWFTELGCPAIDRGSNQPNVFVDPKSSESFTPYHSRGFRDDLAQRRFLEASLKGWSEGVGLLGASLNPISPLYGGPMVDPGAIHVWTWDARPYPAFPQRTDLWTDGTNWRLGHWLNGRLANAPADALVAAILQDHGIADFDVSALEAMLDGYIVDGPRTAREEIETILSLIGAVAVCSDGVLSFRSLSCKVGDHRIEALVDGDGPLVEKRRGDAGEPPDEIAIRYLDPDRVYQPGTSTAARDGVLTPRTGVSSFPAVLNTELAERYAARLMAESGPAREEMRFALAPNQAAVEPGDVLTVDGREGRWLTMRIESGDERRIEARRLDPTEAVGSGVGRSAEGVVVPKPPEIASRPAYGLLDLPILPGRNSGGASVALHAKPWMPFVVFAGSSEGRLTRRSVVDVPAVIGRLTEGFAAGAFGVIDHAARLTVRLARGTLSSVTLDSLLAGENAAAVTTEDGLLEILQFLDAEEVAPGVFRLGGFLRGQAGTEGAALLPFPTGSRFVLLNEAVRSLDFDTSEIGRTLQIRLAPAGRPVDDPAVIETSADMGLRSVKPYSPVHLSGCFEANGDCRLGWIRRTRIGGDSWEAEEVPLGEDRELYRLAIAPADASAPVFTTDVASAEFLFDRDRQIDAFGALKSGLAVSVAQVSPVWGSGDPASRTFERPKT